MVSLHLALGSLIWALLWAAALYGWYRARVAVVEAAGERQRTPTRATGRRRTGRRPASRRDLIRAYVALTKPRIIELLLVTTVPAMVLAWRYRRRHGRR